MNFSEYIAILSGDTSLLEKSRIDKKIGVLESLRGGHFRETSQAKSKLENLRLDHVSGAAMVEKLLTDQTLYKSNLQYEKDGVKANPIELIHLGSADPEVIGKYLLLQFLQFKPLDNQEREERIGNLYGFDLVIRSRPGATYSTNGQYQNDFYAVNPATGIKYTYNSGQPNVDNPKLAARNFLNAIDRVDHLVDKYQEDLKKMERDIPFLEALITKPFERDHELKALKAELLGVEKKINQSLQDKHMTRNEEPDMESVSADTNEESPDVGIEKETGIVMEFPISDRVKDLLQRTAIRQGPQPLPGKGRNQGIGM